MFVSAQLYSYTTYYYDTMHVLVQGYTLSKNVHAFTFKPQLAKEYQHLFDCRTCDIFKVSRPQISAPYNFYLTLAYI